MKIFIDILIILALCGFDVSTIQITQPMLINQSHTLSKDYIPELTELDNYQVHPDVIEPYNEMIEAMKQENLTIYIQSAYRSFDYQENLFNNRVYDYMNKGFSEEDAINLTQTIIAYPGQSEHQIGFAIDVTIDGSLTQEFANTEQGKWIQENCWDYGFIIRYQEDKTNVTGIIYEPWHLRYVGKEHSLTMKELDLCLEEYIEYFKEWNLWFQENGM